MSMAQLPCYAVIQRDYTNAGHKELVISEHASIGCANLSAYRHAHLEAGTALNRLEVTFHHFGGYSAYCQTGQPHRDHFEVDVIRGTRREPLQAAGPSSSAQSIVVNVQVANATSGQINQIATANQPTSNIPTMVSSGHSLQQNGPSANPQVVTNGNQPLRHRNSLTDVASSLHPVIQQPAPPVAPGPAKVPSLSGIVVYTVDHTDLKLGEPDSRGCTRVLGVFSSLEVANEAAIKHAKRERRFAAGGNSNCGSLMETRNSADGALLQCRTFQDIRDRFIVDVRAHIMDVLDSGDDFRDYGHHGKSREESEDEDEIPNAKRRRM